MNHLHVPRIRPWPARTGAALPPATLADDEIEAAYTTAAPDAGGQAVSEVLADAIAREDAAFVAHVNRRGRQLLALALFVVLCAVLFSLSGCGGLQ